MYIYIYIYSYEPAKITFKHLIFLFDRKNTNSPTSRRCDRELRSNNCDFIKEFVDFVHAGDLQCKKTKSLNTQNDIGGFRVRKFLH